MSTKGNKSLTKGIPKIKDAFIVIIKTEWNADIVDELEKGCVSELEKSNTRYEVITVPGAFEIPFIIKAYYNSNRPAANAFIALGTIIKGDTPHFDYVCKAVTDGVVSLNLSLDVPVIFGVLTVNNVEQAKQRIGGSEGHKGEEAAITAIKMIGLNKILAEKKKKK
ncbi:MAG: 6,7-dimethyl-8-ribityllumazine synthase [Chitinophagaceae bacterium]|nr:6,7-dimethyl-8-ribityllumazine synthase [Chitinophagaceae bacterium]